MESEDDVNAYLVKISETQLPGGVFAATTIDEARGIVEEQVEQAGIDTSVDEWYEIGGRLQYRCPEDVASITPLRHDQPVTLSPGRGGDGAGLPVKRFIDELVIYTGDGAIERVNDVAHDREERAEITYLNALRKIIRHDQAPWFNVENARDEEPVEPREIDDEALTEELEELEAELAEEREDTIDKAALGEELRSIESNLPGEISDELSDEELRELLCEIWRDKQEFEAAMDLDTSELLQDDEEE